MGTNYLGPFLLTMLLLPCMQRTARAVGCLEHAQYSVKGYCVRAPPKLYSYFLSATSRGNTRAVQ